MVKASLNTSPRLVVNQGKYSSKQLTGDDFVPARIKVNGVTFEIDNIRFSAHILGDVYQRNVMAPAQVTFELQDSTAEGIGGYEFVLRG